MYHALHRFRLQPASVTGAELRAVVYAQVVLAHASVDVYVPQKIASTPSLSDARLCMALTETPHLSEEAVVWALERALRVCIFIDTDGTAAGLAPDMHALPTGSASAMLGVRKTSANVYEPLDADTDSGMLPLMRVALTASARKGIVADVPVRHVHACLDALAFLSSQRRHAAITLAAAIPSGGSGCGSCDHAGIRGYVEGDVEAVVVEPEECQVGIKRADVDKLLHVVVDEHTRDIFKPQVFQESTNRNAL